MAATTYGKGFSAGAEIVPEATYGTLATTGEKKLRLISETLTSQHNLMANEVKAAYGEAQIASVTDTYGAGGTTVCELDYDNFNELLVSAIGAVATATYEPDAELPTPYSVVIDRLVKRFQYTGGFTEELRITGNATPGDSRVRIENDWTFMKCTPSDTALDGVALVSSTPVKMSELTFSIGDISDALAAGDAIPISSFTLRVKNNLKIDYGSGSAYIIQPIREKQREVYFDVTIPRYSDQTAVTAIQTAITNHTQLQATLNFDGPGSDSFVISLPELFGVQDDNFPNVSDHSVMPFNGRFQAFKNVHNTTHMSTVTYEFLIVTAT